MVNDHLLRFGHDLDISSSGILFVVRHEVQRMKALARPSAPPRSGLRTVALHRNQVNVSRTSPAMRRARAGFRWTNWTSNW